MISCVNVGEDEVPSLREAIDAPQWLRMKKDRRNKQIIKKSEDRKQKEAN